MQTTEKFFLNIPEQKINNITNWKEKRFLETKENDNKQQNLDLSKKKNDGYLDFLNIFNAYMKYLVEYHSVADVVTKVSRAVLFHVNRMVFFWCLWQFQSI